ncbi:hypothetical protein [Defluviicoccus vanus]|uniref:hypothetical protein n=1 Tax=Defluviicoccus vanus TaxID=111831 RepID=UPI001CBA5FC4|nr:hypothetical protein [Defluviicoccus vanus]
MALALALALAVVAKPVPAPIARHPVQRRCATARSAQPRHRRGGGAAATSAPGRRPQFVQLHIQVGGQPLNAIVELPHLIAEIFHPAGDAAQVLLKLRHSRIHPRHGRARSHSTRVIISRKPG